MQLEFQVSNKRPYSDEIDPDILKKRKIIERDTIYKMVEIIYSGEAEDEDKNTVWMHSLDIIELFGYDDLAPRYIRIANLVYEIAVRDVAIGSICVNTIQSEEMEPEMSCLKNGSRWIVITPFVVDQKVQYLKTIHLEIDFSYLFADQIAYDFDQLKTLCKQKLTQKIISHNQKFVLDSRKNRIIASVKTIGFADHYNPIFGLINSQTNISFSNLSSKEISIVKEIQGDAASFCQFSISLNNKKSRSSFLGIQKPSVIVSYKDFLDEIYHHFKNTVMFRGFTKELIYEDNCFEVSLNELQGNFTEMADLTHGHKKGLFLHNKTEFKLVTFHDDIIFVKGNSILAKEATFHILKIVNPSKPWVNMIELGKEIRAKKGLTENQRFEVTVSSGTYMVKFQSAEKYPSNNKQIESMDDDFQSRWNFNQNTSLKLSIEPSLKTKMIKSETPLNVATLHFEVEHCPIPEAHSFLAKPKPPVKMEVLEKHLQAAIQDKMNEAVIEGKFFTVKILNETYIITVKTLNFVDEVENNTSHLGFVRENTTFKFLEKPDNLISIVPKRRDLHAGKLIENLNEIGIGGMKEQLTELIRRVVLFQDSNLMDVVESYQMKPTRGLIFYGPPGTGKTTLARNLSKHLGADGDRITFVNGPEIMSKWVGDSEKNVRLLFEKATLAQKKWGKDSPLYTIIFDEFDAIAAKRDQGNGGKARDSVVNQLLGCMDGLNQLDNVLVIGITNRLDILDPAVTRPGRFEFNLEIGLPEVAGRLEIFEIYTRKLIAKNRLAKDVDLKDLANNTKGFSGADIEGLVRTAISYPLARIFKNPEAVGEEREKLLVLKKKDLNRALAQVKDKKSENEMWRYGYG